MVKARIILQAGRSEVDPHGPTKSQAVHAPAPGSGPTQRELVLAQQLDEARIVNSMLMQACHNPLLFIMRKKLRMHAMISCQASKSVSANPTHSWLKSRQASCLPRASCCLIQSSRVTASCCQNCVTGTWLSWSESCNLLQDVSIKTHILQQSHSRTDSAAGPSQQAAPVDHMQVCTHSLCKSARKLSVPCAQLHALMLCLLGLGQFIFASHSLTAAICVSSLCSLVSSATAGISRCL